MISIDGNTNSWLKRCGGWPGNNRQSPPGAEETGTPDVFSLNKGSIVILTACFRADRGIRRK